MLSAFIFFFMTESTRITVVTEAGRSTVVLVSWLYGTSASSKFIYIQYTVVYCLRGSVLVALCIPLCIVFVVQSSWRCVYRCVLSPWLTPPSYKPAPELWS